MTRNTGSTSTGARRSTSRPRQTSGAKKRAPSVASATYLYCAVHAPQRPSVVDAPPGLPGTGPLRVLEAGEALWLVVADAPLSRYGSAPIEQKLQDLDWVSRHALAHETVVEAFMARGTVIPMKLFTLFNSDERAVAHIRGAEKRLRTLLRRLQGCAEWGVRVRLHEVKARQHAAQQATPTTGHVSGTSFLLQKKKAQDAARDVVVRAHQEARALYERLLPLASDARQAKALDGQAATALLLDATFLVPRAGFQRFEAEVRASAARLGGLGVDVTLTGPWPPYHFVGEAA
ncbi:MAG: GvpL/GvpF family gas vesicle protein [Myxococcota bacterium]